MRDIMRKQVLTRGFLGLAILGSSVLISCTNSKPSNAMKKKSDSTAIESVGTGSLYSDTTIVVHIGNDTDFAFLIGEGSQPYMTININKQGSIMAYWGDVTRRRVQLNVDIDDLKQIILSRFEAGDTLKENELFHVGFDVSTPRNIILALKDMMLEIGVHHCELAEFRDWAKEATMAPPPPGAVTVLEGIDVVENDV